MSALVIKRAKPNSHSKSSSSLAARTNMRPRTAKAKRSEDDDDDDDDDDDADTDETGNVSLPPVATTTSSAPRPARVQQQQQQQAMSTASTAASAADEPTHDAKPLSRRSALRSSTDDLVAAAAAEDHHVDIDDDTADSKRVITALRARLGKTMDRESDLQNQVSALRAEVARQRVLLARATALNGGSLLAGTGAGPTSASALQALRAQRRALEDGAMTAGDVTNPNGRGTPPGSLEDNPMMGNAVLMGSTGDLGSLNGAADAPADAGGNGGGGDMMRRSNSGNNLVAAASSSSTFVAPQPRWTRRERPSGVVIAGVPSGGSAGSATTRRGLTNGVGASARLSDPANWLRSSSGGGDRNVPAAQIMAASSAMQGGDFFGVKDEVAGDRQLDHRYDANLLADDRGFLKSSAGVGISGMQ